MPIEANIPLDVRPVQAPDITQAYGNALAMKSHIQQQQLQQKQMQAVDLENQQRQRTMDASQALAKAMSRNTQIGGDGSVATNYAGAVKDLTDAGYGPEALKLDTDRRANATAAYQQEEAANKVIQQRANRVGQVSGAILGIDEASRPEMLRNGLTQLAAEKILPPDTVRQILAQPYGPQTEAILKQWQMGSMDVSKQLEAFQNNLRNLREQHLADAQINKINAEMPKIQTESEHAVLSDFTGELATAPTYGDYNNQWATKPDLQAKVPDFRAKDPAAPMSEEDRRAVRQVGLTGEQQTQEELRRQAEQDRKEGRADALDLRRQIADQTAAFRDASLALRGGGPKMTRGQQVLEERNISQIEDGTPSRPGLNSLRIRLGSLLTPKTDKDGKPIYTGKDAKVDGKGNPIYNSDGTLTAAGDGVAAGLEAASRSLQATQFRKAKLYGIQAPDQEDINAAEDGAEIQANDGATWKKQNGVAFFKSMGQNGAPQLPSAQPQQPAAPSPATQPPTSGDRSSSVPANGAGAKAPAAPPAAPTAPKIPPAAQSVHDALKSHNIPVQMIDGADGLPILSKDGKQYKVLGADKDGNLQLQPGVWK